MSNLEDNNQNEDLFFRAFIGEYVQVVSSIGNEPIEVNGFLLHKDETYLYLGASLERIDAVVRCNSVVIIQVNDEGNIHPLLDDMPEPKSDGDIQ